MGEPVICSIADRVAVITLNRPAARNALNSEVLKLLPEVAKGADDDSDVDVIILTGADPAFCAGLDLKELGSAGSDLLASLSDGDSAGALRRGPFPRLAKPVIGAINGPAVTGGLELALACDFLIASERAKFADTHARVGIHPAWGLSVLLPRAVGVGRAREMSATGRFVDAETALAWGLVNHVVEHDGLLPFCLGLAADIASSDQQAVRKLFGTYDRVIDSVDEKGWAIESEEVRDFASKRALDPSEVARRREGIIQRGSSQA